MGSGGIRNDSSRSVMSRPVTQEVEQTSEERLIQLGVLQGVGFLGTCPARLRGIWAGGDHLGSTGSLKQEEWVGPPEEGSGETHLGDRQQRGGPAQVSEVTRTRTESFLDERTQLNSVLELASQWQCACRGPGRKW